MKRRTIDWKAVGRLTAAIVLIPALVVAICTVQHNTAITIPAIIVALWAEYRLGFMR